MLAHDLKILLVAATVATVAAVLSASLRSAESPNWAVRVYLQLMRLSGIPPLSRYARTPRVYSGREGLLAIWFLVFFLIFAISVSMWPSCGRQSC
jgi:hypothetical protein